MTSRNSSIDAPRMTVLPRDQRVIDGAIASFQCRASGNPVPQVYWRRAGRRVSVGRQRYTVVAAPLGGSLLRIEPVKAARDDDSSVECVAENGVGDPVTATARLHVYRDEEGQLVFYPFSGRFFLYVRILHKLSHQYLRYGDIDYDSDNDIRL